MLKGISLSVISLLFLSCAAIYGCGEESTEVPFCQEGNKNSPVELPLGNYHDGCVAFSDKHGEDYFLFEGASYGRYLMDGDSFYSFTTGSAGTYHITLSDYSLPQDLVLYSFSDQFGTNTGRANKYDEYDYYHYYPDAKIGESMEFVVSAAGTHYLLVVSEDPRDFTRYKIVLTKE